jgi:Ni/Co efflux regulator RcnB
MPSFHPEDGSAHRVPQAASIEKLLASPGITWRFGALPEFCRNLATLLKFHCNLHFKFVQLEGFKHELTDQIERIIVSGQGEENMRKIIMAALAASVIVPTVAVPTMASAQSAREVRESARDVRQSQREVDRNVRRGDYRAADRSQRQLNHDRRELREDWRDYRQAHRGEFRRPAYAGPRGYRYRPVAVGYRFQPAYYGSRYWVNDYGRYRLPAPRAGHRWVRYGNDVAMVNMRSGRVVTVHNSLFF